MSKVWRTVGSARKSKAGKTYLKIDGDIKAGETVQLQNPREKIQASVEAGRLTEEKAEAMLAKLPDYILYDLVIPPAKD